VPQAVPGLYTAACRLAEGPPLTHGPGRLEAPPAAGPV